MIALLILALLGLLVASRVSSSSRFGAMLSSPIFDIVGTRSPSAHLLGIESAGIEGTAARSGLFRYHSQASYVEPKIPCKSAKPWIYARTRH